MGQSISEMNGGIESFTVTPSVYNTNYMKFTITDSANLLTTSKMIRAVLEKAFSDYQDVQTVARTGDSYKTFNFSAKTLVVNMGTATAAYDTSALTVETPFSDV